ncbi:MAG: thrombospondin type 3 repeat-containing protein, partial [Nannocystaceae bacterium]|nr:thrombospondin type 3 repeat-containing protein [Nannocystaceae bacterium]
MVTNRIHWLKFSSLAVLSMFCASGCTTPTEDLGMVPDDGAQGGTSENTLTDGWTSGDGQTSGADLTSSDTSATGGELQTCGIVERACCSDQDRDSVPASMDNEPFIFNPDQADRDGDGLIDIADSCPTIGDGFVGDSDNDGLGNACDRCRQSPSQYNDVFEGASVAAFMLVRNIPTNADADHDGIGDACDNCPTVPNCGDFNEANPYVLGDAISYDDDTVCQTDSDGNGVGDACEGLMSGNAAGPAGLGPTDDHDQDGIANLNDACPRLPLLDTVACSDADPCPDGRQCSPEGTCNHVDSDGDGVGDRCDTCHAVANPNQIGVHVSMAQDRAGTQVVKQDRVGPLHPVHRLERQQFRIAGAGADEGDVAFAVGRVFMFRQKGLQRILNRAFAAVIHGAGAGVEVVVGPEITATAAEGQHLDGLAEALADAGERAQRGGQAR